MCVTCGRRSPLFFVRRIFASLREEFASRFAGVRPLAAEFKLFTAPFDFPVDDAPVPLQMELVELQCNDALKARFYNYFPLPFFGDIALYLFQEFSKVLTKLLRTFNAS